MMVYIFKNILKLVGLDFNGGHKSTHCLGSYECNLTFLNFDPVTVRMFACKFRPC